MPQATNVLCFLATGKTYFFHVHLSVGCQGYFMVRDLWAVRPVSLANETISLVLSPGCSWDNYKVSLSKALYT